MLVVRSYIHSFVPTFVHIHSFIKRSRRAQISTEKVNKVQKLKTNNDIYTNYGEEVSFIKVFNFIFVVFFPYENRPA